MNKIYCLYSFFTYVSEFDLLPSSGEVLLLKGQFYFYYHCFCCNRDGFPSLRIWSHFSHKENTTLERERETIDDTNKEKYLSHIFLSIPLWSSLCHCFCNQFSLLLVFLSSFAYIELFICFVFCFRLKRLALDLKKLPRHASGWHWNIWK